MTVGCSVEGCRRQHGSRGFCDMHYTRWKRHGDALRIKKDTRARNYGHCKADGCERQGRSLGFCHMHYSRWKRHGDPAVNLRPGTGWVSAGYKEVSVAGQTVREHRIVMEKKLGRKLQRWEDVHHIDRNGLNNSEDNLELLPHAEHTELHHREGY